MGAWMLVRRPGHGGRQSPTAARARFAARAARLTIEWVTAETDPYQVGLKAFVVEDNATIRENLVGALEELTCVRVAGTAAGEDEAHGWLHERGAAWDLVIIDLFLKSGSGMRLAQRIARRQPGQKVIVFSNYVNASVRKRCAQLGVDAVFDKSTEIDALLDYCARLCAQVEARIDPARA